MGTRLRSIVMCTAMLAFAAVSAEALAETARPAASPLERAQKPRVLLVGPGRYLRAPSDAARIARDGDIVAIDPGEYEDCAVWRANRLTLRGNGGLAHVLRKTCQGKGIWVIDADGTTVERIRFTDAAVAERNGAGIKLTSGGLTVRDSVFEDNENGILIGPMPGKTVTIERSRFERNGKCEPDCAHGIYVGAVERLTVTDSIFRGQKIGHHIKSRARNTTVTGTAIDDGADGTASYLIDLPNAGNALIAGNKLHKGRRSDNASIAIAYGLEGAINPTDTVRIENNVFHSDLPNQVDFVRNGTTTPIKLSGNRLCGKVLALRGPGTAASGPPCE